MRATSFLNSSREGGVPSRRRAAASNLFFCSSGLSGGSLRFGMCSLSHLSVGKSLTINTTQQLLSTFLVVHAKGHASIMPKIKLCQVAMQMTFATVLISSTHATLEDAEVTFDRVRVDIPANVFFGAMFDSAMLSKMAQLAIILQCVVGHHARLAD